MRISVKISDQLYNWILMKRMIVIDRPEGKRMLPVVKQNLRESLRNVRLVVLHIPFENDEG